MVSIGDRIPDGQQLLDGLLVAWLSICDFSISAPVIIPHTLAGCKHAPALSGILGWEKPAMPHPTIDAPETLREFAPHALPAEAVAQRLATSPDGLSVEEARRRLQYFGANEIEGIKPISIPA
jgi:hypothetical protein